MRGTTMMQHVRPTAAAAGSGGAAPVAKQCRRCGAVSRQRLNVVAAAAAAAAGGAKQPQERQQQLQQQQQQARRQHHYKLAVPAVAAAAAAVLRGRGRGVAAAAAAAAAAEPAGNGAGASAPTPAETARTVADICREGVLCTVQAGGGGGAPLGTPVAYRLDADGSPVLELVAGSPEAANLAAAPACSLLVQPSAFPARGLAAVALQGTAVPVDDDPEGAASDGGSTSSATVSFRLAVERVAYYGGLDGAPHGAVIAGDAYRAAEPDLLRAAAPVLIAEWNSDRAEDVYRVVAAHLGAPLAEMVYAELLWVDRGGMYVRAELLGRAPAVVRVPFFRPALDERDARSVITMASHVGWEAEKRYTPPPPQPVAAAAAAAPAGSNN